MKTQFFTSSSFSIQSTGDDRLVELIERVGGTKYISGVGGKKYQFEEKFKKNNIQLVYSDFVPFEYKQMWGDFVPGLSILDFMLNHGIDMFFIKK